MKDLQELQELRGQAAIFADNERGRVERDAAEAELARLAPGNVSLAIDQECRKVTA